MADGNKQIEQQTPAESFHVIEFIDDELEARGWSRESLAIRMEGDSSRNFLALELLDLKDPRCLLGDEMASKLAIAFGTGKLLWINLDRTWRAAQTTQSLE